MSPPERKSISNGIWLCRQCAKVIDSDARKYPVDVLYRWRRAHEDGIECELGGTLPNEAMREHLLALLADESRAAQQIAIDQPEYWEFLLSLEVLREHFRVVRQDLRDLRRGAIFRRASVPEGPLGFISWVQGRFADLTAIVELLNVAAIEDLPKAWGEPGEPGDLEAIHAACHKIVTGCRSLVEWEIEVHHTIFPEVVEDQKPIMMGWTEQVLDEMHRIPLELERMFEGTDEPQGILTVELVFKEPEGLAEFTQEVLGRLARAVGLE